ncbi:MAG: glutamate racemase [Chloroflexi bacterium]|nr:glutamate racemase [Chloroflexota bacterium]
MPDHRPIGVFDSGVGGLTILKEIEIQQPRENLLYLADTANCPYGAKTQEEIRRLAHGIVTFLLDQGAKLVVVACNTASVASLAYLRETFPVPFVGIVPAVKPAALSTHNRRIGVMATNATFQTEIFDDLVQKFASDVVVLRQVCPGLVELVEAGEVDTERAERLLRQYLDPLLAQKVDALVLGCTHYPFLQPLIEKIVGSEVAVIDPAAAVARQVGRVLDARDLRTSRTQHGDVRFFTSGDASLLAQLLRKLTGRQLADVARVTPIPRS